MASAWSLSISHGQCKETFRRCEKALLELYRPCKRDLDSWDLLKGKSRAVAIALSYRHTLLLDPGRSKVNLARYETFLRPTGRWLEVPFVPSCLSATSSAGNNMTTGSCTNTPTGGMIRSPRVLSCLIKSHFSSPVSLA